MELSFLIVYLGDDRPPAGASFGLQASGLPSGAQQVPVTGPCGDRKVHAFPLLKDLHDASASGGGMSGPPLPSAGCAASTQHAVKAVTNTVRLNTLPKGKVKISLDFIGFLRLFGKHLHCRFPIVKNECGENMCKSVLLKPYHLYCSRPYCWRYRIWGGISPT